MEERDKKKGCTVTRFFFSYRAVWGVRGGEGLNQLPTYLCMYDLVFNIYMIKFSLT